MESKHITDFDPGWNDRSFIIKIIKVLLVLKNFQVLVLHYDYRFAFVLGLLAKILPINGQLKKVVFVTLLVDTSKYSKLNFISFFQWLLLCLFIRIPNLILVHTSHEVIAYRKLFHDAKNDRIAMINYFSYNDFKEIPAPRHNNYKSDYVVCAGNHRDIETFIDAVEKIDRINAIVVAGEGDREKWESYKHDRIHILFNQPYKKYQNIIANSKALIIPIKRRYPIRSLGLIAAFEAVYLQIPIIASKTFHLKDYYTNRDIFYFNPECSVSLSKQIIKVIERPVDVRQRVNSAFQKTKYYYSRDQFLNNLYIYCLNESEL